MTLFGIADGFSDTFIMVLLPMTLADKNRQFAYELTMLGTIIALVNLVIYFITQIMASVTIFVLTTDTHLGNVFNRCLIIFMLIMSTIVFWKQACFQMEELRFRRRQLSRTTNEAAEHASVLNSIG